MDKKIHHANLVLGDDAKDFIIGILENELEFKIQSNPDFFLFESEAFGIDDARSLERWAIGKPILGGAKATLLLIKSITFEAQNALLKILEEPPMNTYFFINIQSLGGLLPTFLSRVMILNKSGAEGEKADTNFLNSDVKGRLSIVRSLSKKENKTEMKKLIRDLEEISFRELETRANLKSAFAAKKILTAKILSSARGSSPKMLLEWLSCMV